MLRNFCLFLIAIMSAALSISAETPGKLAPKPLFRDPVFDGAADPVLVWNPHVKKWYMFYTNRRASAPGLPRVTYVHGTRIGIAESADLGATWKYVGTTEINYGKKDYTHWAPEIVEHNGVWHMYLSIVPGIFEDWNAPRDIIHLTSRDLRKWKYESILNLNSDRVIDANIIRLPNGSWRMWFKNERGKNGQLYYADSPDLYKWTSNGIAIPEVKGEGAKIFHWKGSYWLIADVWDGLAVFRSSDCLSWQRQESILKEAGRQPTDRSKGHHADVVVSGDRAFIFYFVHQGEQDAEGKDPEYRRRTAIQVAELAYANGTLACDRNKPVHIQLEPPVYH